MKPFYITTSIAYPNANPHIGYAMELVQADFFARYYRLAGRNAYFLTGIDEHGLKIQKTALEAGVAPQAFVDEKAEVYQGLAKALGLTNDRFIRTTDADHEKVAQALWLACLKKGDIYKKRYQAWYNVKEEEFLGTVDEFPDSSVFGIDPRFIEKIDEENYFFALSRYGSEIEESLTGGKYTVFPMSRLQEVMNQVTKTGWQDISVSREKSKLSWGVPVPNDDTQVMYVWFDALANYLTAVSTVDGQGIIQTNEFWPANVHCVGKDIHRFHILIWSGMLLSADIELPEQLIVHGFLTSGGQKMSKSLGNVVDPFATLEAWGQDAVRWYLLRQVPTTGDADFTEERLAQVYSADLSNDYGNLVSRVWAMCQKYCGGKVPTVAGEQVNNLEKILVAEKWRQYHLAVESREIDVALGYAHELMVFCNKRIDERKPWAMAKDPEQTSALQETLYELLEIIRHISCMLQPAIPQATSKVIAAIFPTSLVWDNFEKASTWGLLVSGSPLGTESLILFPRKEA